MSNDWLSGCDLNGSRSSTGWFWSLGPLPESRLYYFTGQSKLSSAKAPVSKARRRRRGQGQIDRLADVSANHWSAWQQESTRSETSDVFDRLTHLNLTPVKHNSTQATSNKINTHNRIFKCRFDHPAVWSHLTYHQTHTDRFRLSSCIYSHVTSIAVQSVQWLHALSRCCTPELWV